MKKFINTLGNTLGSTLRKLVNNVKEDFEATQRQRSKYDEEHVRQRLPILLITDIGVQSMAAIRLMQAAEELAIPYGGEIVSRLIRYVYNMEIHPHAKIDPGISLIHGVGLVVCENAHVQTDCIIAHNVTLTAVWDHELKQMRGPTLEKNVHIGPGANIMGPVTIGAHSKIMARSFVTESVPAHSLISPAMPSRTVSKKNEDTPDLGLN